MKNFRKLVVAACLMIAVSIVPVFAQQSNTFLSTAGSVRADADDFMDVRYFNNVDFNKFYSFVNLSNSGFNLGLGNHIGNVYLGTYYDGNLWGGITNNKKTTTKVDGSTTKTEITETKSSTFDNEFDVLVGWNNMGFKLANEFGASDVAGTKSSYYNGIFTWGGLSIPVSSMNVRPYVSLGGGFNNEETVVGDVTKVTTINDSSAFIATLGSDFEFGKGSSIFSVAGISYTFDGNFMKDGAYEIETDPVEEITYSRKGGSKINNILTPYYRFEYSPLSNLKLGGKFSLPFAISSSNDGTVTISEYDKLTKETSSVTIETYKKGNTFTIEPSFGLGFSYNVKPTFAFNMGYGAYFPKFASSKTTIYKDEKTTIVEENKSTGDYNHYLTAGFAWDISDNCLLDVAFSTPLNNPSFALLWNTSLDLGFTLKI